MIIAATRVPARKEIARRIDVDHVVDFTVIDPARRESCSSPTNVGGIHWS